MFSLSLNRVHDRLKIREGDDSLVLTVDGDAQRMVAGLLNVRERSVKMVQDNGEGLDELARYFAETLFGAEQAEKLFEFYRGNSGCVYGICSQYFTKRLNKLVTKAQRKTYAAERQNTDARHG